MEVIDLRRTKTESDHELGKLSRENDQLKKDIKEIQNKYNQSKAALQQYMNKEGNEVSSKSKEIQAKYDELNNNLKKISVKKLTYFSLYFLYLDNIKINLISKLNLLNLSY